MVEYSVVTVGLMVVLNTVVVMGWFLNITLKAEMNVWLKILIKVLSPVFL